MYTFNGRVSYSEVDDKGLLNIPGIVNYFQDASLFHSHDVGLNLPALKELHRAWLLSTWHIVFKRFPSMGERLQICTWPYDFKAIYGMRNYLLKTEAEEVLAYADSCWFLFDSELGRPVKATEPDIGKYEMEPPYEMEHLPRKVTLPENLEYIETVSIYQNQLDTNQHVNNGEYVRISCNYLPWDFTATELRVEYRNSAHSGNSVHIYTKDTEKYFYVILANEEGTPYTISEFKKGQP